jgi:hypothetical protein
MNRFLFLPVCFALITDAYAQGTVLFYNHVPTIGLDAPVFDVGGQSFLAGWPFYAQLYAGPAASSLTPIGSEVVFQAGPGAGYWIGFNGGLTRIITTVAPGESAFVQVRVFSVLTGGNYEDVLARGGKHGESLIFSVITGDDTKNGTQPPSLPAYLTGLQSFSLTGVDPAVPAVPEPTTTALLLTGGLIAGVLRYERRRRETARPVRGQC